MSARLFVVPFLLAGMVGMTRPAMADPPRTYQNGDVIIGTQDRGADLPADEWEKPLLVVIDTPYQVFDEAGTFIQLAAWKADGTPVRRGKVYLSNHLVGRTDEHGTFAFRWGVPGSDVADYWVNGSTITVRWEDGGDTYGGQVWFSAFSRTQSFASDHLFVYTDRGIYNPGQTIHIRSIGWHLTEDFSPINAASIDYLLTDPSGQPAGGSIVVTDDFGIAAADIHLPEQAEEGMYELTATYEGATASTRLRVERFVAPVIDIEHTLGRFLTRDIAELAFDVTLGYFTGGEFRQGSITVEALVDGTSRFNRTIDVTGPGPHHFAIGGDDLAAIRRDLYEDQRVEMTIAVEDSYGRRDDLTRELRYTVNPYIAIIERDQDAYATGDTAEVVVRLTDRERVPVRDTEVILTTSRNERFTARTDAGGTVQFSLEMRDNSFEIEVFLADVESPLASDTVAWHEPQPMRTHIADAIVQENQPAHVEVTFPSHFVPAEDVVHMDVVDTSGSLVNSVIFPIRHEGGRYVAEGSFTAPSWGSMLLTFFCLGSDSRARGRARGNETHLGLMTEGQNLVVQPGRELTIELTGVTQEVAPGADFEGTIRVVDPHGNPVEASVGVALVDRSVISLKDPLEITPMDHFYNPELRVISTTGSAILTWPVVSRNWGDRQMDIALPPFPYLEGGSIAPVSARGGGGFGWGASGGDDGVMYDAEMAPASPMMMMESAMMAPSEPMAEGLGLMSREMAGDGRVAQAPAPIITIRTEFPETSLWMPFLRTSGGQAAISGTMPDSITEQEFAIVASSASGGVGLLRQSVRVTQPLFVRSDLPDTLTVGDRILAHVAVQNLTDVSQQVEVAIQSGDIQVAGAPVTVAVEAQGTTVATFPIAVTAAGPHRYTISARTAEREDSEVRDIWVRPSGLPRVSILDAGSGSGEIYTMAFEVPEVGQYNTLSLNMAFPAISAGFAGLDAIQTDLQSTDLMSMGGELIATALLYGYQRQHDATPAVLEKMRLALSAVMNEILAAQASDGGWGFWWDAKSNPYITAYCLEAMSTLVAVDIPVPDSAIQRAVDYLATWHRTDNLYDFSAIAFWEGDSQTVRLALSAEIFRIMAEVPPNARTGNWSMAMVNLAGFFQEYLDTDSPEIMAYANAILGLYRLDGTGLATVTRERLIEAARRLDTLRQEGHWEPSWFNAYGGTIEATVTVLAVYQALGGDFMAGDMRGAVRYLLSTRDEWGGWHNPRGTASAIRGLLILAPPEDEVANTVEVMLDGVRVGEVNIDPADPFMSAITLRNLDLGTNLAAGEHQVRVRYSGRLEPQVRAIFRHWEPVPPSVASSIRLEGSLSANRMALGEALEYRLRLESTSENAELVQVTLVPPATAEFERQAVQALKDGELIYSYSWTDSGLTLDLQLPAGSERDLVLRVVSIRQGEVAVPWATAIVVSSRQGDQQSVSVALLDGLLTVE